ncbi:MAG: hypothetical protein Q4G65_15465 [bacterium]|nr:hypothetical protein [bacterium]
MKMIETRNPMKKSMFGLIALMARGVRRVGSEEVPVGPPQGHAGHRALKNDDDRRSSWLMKIV